MKTSFSFLAYCFTAANAFTTSTSLKASSAAATTTDSSPETSMPTTTSTSIETTVADLDNTFGVTVEAFLKCPPAGKYFMGVGQSQMLLEDGKNLVWWQNAELKHGRVAMLATIGYYVQKSGIYFGPAIYSPNAGPWYLSKIAGLTFRDVSQAADPYAAYDMLPKEAIFQIFLAAFFIEISCNQYMEDTENLVPGQVGWDPLNFAKDGFDTDKMKKMRMRELKHGRMAMMALAGWIANDMIPGALPFWHP